MLVRITNREDPDEANMCLRCLSMPFLAGNYAFDILAG